MIRIKKILVVNFKGMHSPTEIDFCNPQDNSISILAGANGFGKTTIFDALEVCFTGKFHRVRLFNDVQKKNSHKAKPFYQNKDGEDVVIKLLMEETETHEQIVIIKHYDDSNPIKSTSGGRHNIPIESSGFFRSYVSNDVNLFNSNDFTGVEEKTQEDINKLIYGTEDTSLESTYYLFNYIQQEDSLYFLKQSEDSKGKSLGFLFNITEEETKQEALREISQSLNDNQSRLSNEIDAIKEFASPVNAVEYKRLFENKQFPFDGQNPFSNPKNAGEQLIQFQELINGLITFRDRFSPDEYIKHLQYKSLNEEVIPNAGILEAFLLRNVASKDAISELLSRNDKRKIADTHLKRTNKHSIDDKVFESFIVDENSILTYRQVINELQKIDSELGELERIMGDLNQAREKTVTEFKKLVEHNHIPNSKCPLCDSVFPTLNELLDNISRKTASLEAHNSKRGEERKNIIIRLETICQQVDKIVTDYFDSVKPVEQDIENLLRGLDNLNNMLNSLIQKHPEFGGVEISTYQFSQIPLTKVEVDSKVVQLKEYLIKNVLVKYQYNEQLIANKRLYLEYFDGNKELFNSLSAQALSEKLNYLKYIQGQLANNRLQFLISRREKLERIKVKVDGVNQKLFQTIKAHKVDMIKRIKIPFYVFSGKILQSYQQGSGIFVDIHETGQNNNVKFFTGASSDHDIVYHLSSGQMAVVALAFCLSLNKVYNTNKGFKFLAIDDPIQTMDDLNVHTFVELLRNEFSDYQIIMSTHDDFTSRYMKYKFDKFGMKTKIHNVQQLVLEQSLN